jgi:molecular chaperone DnaK
VELCRRALAEKGLAPADIERVLLVGGATLAPALRELLADPGRGLGIRLDHSLDPVTVVARGAALFARTQRLPQHFTGRSAEAGEVLLDFAHKPTGQSGEPLVGGTARTADGGPRDWTGCTVEFVDDAEGRTEWRSGQVPLGADGSFATRLRARAAHTSYAVEFRAAHGSLLPTVPARTSYQRLELVGGDATMSHSVGVWVEGNEVAWILRKGTELPATGRLVLESTVDVRRGGRQGLIRVPIVQGERARGDRNPVVGQLDISPEEITRDVPQGSEIEITVEIDQSFRTRVDAYIPVLDEEFEIDVELARDAPDVDALRRQTRAVAAQYAALRDRASTSGAERAAELLDGFDEDGGVGGIDRELESAGVNPDGAAIVQERLRQAETALDEAEEALKLPQLVRAANDVRDWVRDAVREHGDAAARQDLAEAERRLDEAVAGADPTLVAHATDVLRGVGLRVLDAADQLPVLRFASLKETFAGSTEPRVTRLLTEGAAALAADDIPRLRSVVIDLGRLVPYDAVRPDLSLDTTVRRQR